MTKRKRKPKQNRTMLEASKILADLVRSIAIAEDKRVKEVTDRLIVAGARAEGKMN